MPPKPIPTVYKGVQMRSRLEATWAAFFDLMGWQWSYEPIDLDGWTPNFALELDWADQWPHLSPDARGGRDYAAFTQSPKECKKISELLTRAQLIYSDPVRDNEKAHKLEEQARTLIRALDATPAGRIYVEVKPVWSLEEPPAQEALMDMRRNNIHSGLLLGVQPQGQRIGWFPAMYTELLADYIGKHEDRGCDRLDSFDLAVGKFEWGDALCHAWWNDSIEDDLEKFQQNIGRSVVIARASDQLAELWTQAKNATQWRSPNDRSAGSSKARR